MKISSLIDIVDGELLNSPSISFINSIKTDPNRVKTSDLFIAKNIEDLKIAIENGAYAVIFEKDFEVLDSEVAFIKVENLQMAMIKIFRFKLSNIKLKSYFCSTPTFDLFKIYQHNFGENIYLISKNIEKAFKFIDELKDDDILISKDENLINKIYPNSQEFEKNIYLKNIQNLVKHTLFEISFSYKDNYFSRIKLPTIYLNNFLNIYEFLKKDIDAFKLKNYSNFKAIFIDKNFEPLEFGKSSSFIICQNSLELVKEEINYIKNEFKYAKTIFIAKNKVNYLKEDEQILLKNLNNLKNLLLNLDFNCVYMIDFNYKEVLEYLQKPHNSPTLF